MQFKKLSQEQRSIKRWRAARNRLVSKLLTDNPRMLRAEALAEANRVMRSKHP